MRWSHAHIPTLRDDPSDAEAVSHRLLVRGGYIRQLMSGVYSMLPLGYRVRAKVMDIVREEIEAIGGQEFLLPVLHPREIWEKTGRAETMADIMLTLEDQRGTALVLGPTHEEIFTTIAKELTSYRQLPQLWFHIQTKFRDEARPKSGLLRVREFTMKDSYTFDVDEAGLDVQFTRHYGAYRRIFSRLGMETVPVEASSGAMGGSESVEFMVRADIGEDDVAHCAACGYAANVGKATSRLAPIDDDPGPEAPERFATPGVRTIRDLADFSGGADADRQINTLVYLLAGEPVLVLLRGDHDLVEQKLIDGTGVTDVRPAGAEEIAALLGADAGSLGAVGVSDVRILADPALRERRSMTTGANENDVHVRGVDVARDVAIDEWLDLRLVRAGEACPQCGEALDVFSAIEVGHIFKLGTKHSTALGAAVLDAAGDEVTIVMGSYGIGVERAMAASVEANHDDQGITWPVSIAPYEAVVTVLNVDDAETAAAAGSIYEGLVAEGVDVLIDDRDARAGVKFADAELIGIPYRITVGPRGLANDEVELTVRRDGATSSLPTGDVVARVAESVRSGRLIGR